MKLTRSLPLAAAAAALLLAGAASAQSAKFAAAWEDGERIVDAQVASDSDGIATDPVCLVDGVAQQGPCVLAETVLTRLRVPQQKDMMIGVSGQIGLHTFTQAKGKSTEPSLGSATAAGSVRVTVQLRDPFTGEVVQTAAPGPVVFAARMQELRVDLASTDLENLTEVTVGLMLDTTAAHHFNFIGVDLDSGDYDVVAVFDLSAFVAIAGEDAIARAKVTLGPRMVTAEEVRAVKGSLVSFD